MAFCDNLQFLRKRDGITQEELAERLSVSRQSVSKWETGDSYPETDKIISLCRMFGVSMDALVMGDVASGINSSADTEKDGAGKRDGGNDGSVNGDGENGSARGNDGEEAAEKDIFYMTPEEAEKVEKFSDLPERVKKASKRVVIGHAVNSVLFACAMVAFFCLGAILNLWHPAWLLFPLCFSVCAFTDKIFACKKDGTVAPLGKRILKGFSSSVWLFAVTVYLFIGIMYSLWHPGWVIFVACAFLSPACEAISHAVFGKKK